MCVVCLAYFSIGVQSLHFNLCNVPTLCAIPSFQHIFLYCAYISNYVMCLHHTDGAYVFQMYFDTCRLTVPTLKMCTLPTLQYMYYDFVN